MSLSSAALTALFGTWSSETGEKVTMKIDSDEFMRVLRIGSSKEMRLPTNSDFLWDRANSQLVITADFTKLKLVGTFAEDGKTLTLKGGNENVSNFEAVLTNPNGAGLPKGFFAADKSGAKTGGQNP